MRVFVTGGSGYVGTVTVPELISHGHTVLALARSDTAAAKVKKLGADVLRGSLEDLEILQKACKETDATIHMGMLHDLAEFDKSMIMDRAAIEAMSEALKGSGKRLIITSGTLMCQSPDGTRLDETWVPGVSPVYFLKYRAETEKLFVSKKSQGFKPICVRLSPTVHGENDAAFIPALIGLAKQNGTAYYIGDGSNRWSAVHKKDAAVVYRLVLEKGEAGDVFHAISELVTLKEISEAIAKKVGVGVKSISKSEAAEKLSFMADLVALDAPAKCEITKSKLGWTTAIGPGLLQDIAENY